MIPVESCILVTLAQTAATGKARSGRYDGTFG
jgi:hypothetical protein